MPNVERVVLILDNDVEIWQRIVHSDDLVWVRVRAKLGHPRSGPFREIIGEKRPFVIIGDVFHDEVIALLQAFRQKTHFVF